MNKLALGSVQFGLNYGIANEIGKTKFSEVKEILILSKESKINIIDTASNYGESEHILGETGIKKFNYVTKLPKIPIDCKDVDHWVQNIVENSLSKLKVNCLYGLLIHRTEDLSGKFGKKLIKAIQQIKFNGLTKKIGISIYEIKEIERALDLIKLDIVQAPLNIVDRRLELSGILNKLNNLKIEVHTRSTFLQGLLLLPRNKIPNKFNRWSNMWDRWHMELKKNKLDAIEVCLSYPLSLPQVNKIIVGVDSKLQLQNIITAASKKNVGFKFSFMQSNDIELINPTRWSSL